MAMRYTILNELKGISALVAELPLSNPFKVPDGYFEQLPLQVLSLVTSHPDDDFKVFPGKEKLADPFTAPAGYFDQLADNLLNHIRASSGSAREEIEMLSPVLSKLDKTSPFSLPEGYFSDMPVNVVAGIKAIDFVQAELEVVPSQLLEMKKKNVFTVPEGYFEQLPQQMLKRVKPKTKILAFNLPGRIVRYAAAAAVIGVMVIGYFLFYNDKESMVAVNDANIMLDSSLKNVSDADIRNYVENNTVTLPDPLAINETDLQQQDMKDMLAEVTDKDIESYLEAYGIAKGEIIN